MNENKIQRLRNISAPPMKSLEDSINYSKKLYEVYSHNRFTKAEIASVLSFSASSGGFAYVLSSLRAFSLITQDRDGFCVSDLFKRINISEKGSTEFRKLCFEAIAGVPLYAELLNEYKLKLPPCNIVAQKLELGRKIHKNTAKTIANIFEESLKYAGVLDTNNNLLPIRNDINPAIHETMNLNEVVDTTIQKAKNNLSIDIVLSNERVAKVIYPIDISAEDAKKISNVLRAIASTDGSE